MWEALSKMVAERSVETDTLYVWGWYPGIYVMSQRDSASSSAVYGNMHSDPPDRVGRTIEGIVGNLEKAPPKFIIDAQKSHYPYYDHPNFYLWPRGLVAENRMAYASSTPSALEKEQSMQWVEERSYTLMTAAGHANGPIAEDRARELARLERSRHEAMLPLREFLMEHYNPIYPVSEIGLQFYGNNIPSLDSTMHIFQRKDSPGR